MTQLRSHKEKTQAVWFQRLYQLVILCFSEEKLSFGKEEAIVIRHFSSGYIALIGMYGLLTELVFQNIFLPPLKIKSSGAETMCIVFFEL